MTEPRSGANQAQTWLLLEIAMGLMLLAQLITLGVGTTPILLHVGFAVGAAVVGIGADIRRRRAKGGSA